MTREDASPPLDAPSPLLLRALAKGAARLPLSALPLLGAALAFIAGTFLRIRRRHVQRAMTRGGIADPRAVAWRMYRSLGTSIGEFLWFSGRGPEALDDLVEIDETSRDRLARALARRKGVVLAASHTGNWDLAACAVARQVPLLVVTKRLSLRGLDAFWQGARARAGVRLAEPRGALRAARAMLRSGGAVAMMIDQVPDGQRRAMVVPFLGEDAWVDLAPATVAMRTGAPLVVAAARRQGARHRLHVLALLEPPSGAPSPAEQRAWIGGATREATVALDAFVRAHPDQWLWLHRRWRAPHLSPAAGLGMPGKPCTTPS